MSGVASHLIEILNNPDAGLDERDDAAMDLATFDGEEVEKALAVYVVDESADYLLQSSCGESLGEIWIRRGDFDRGVIERATLAARGEILGLFAARRPEWLEPFQVDVQ